MNLKRLESVDYIVVHCSATKPSVKVDAAMINRWHREKGWLKIGYHFVIGRDGKVETGRELHEVGAHVAGFNHVSIGICLAGGVGEDGKAENNFTPDQFAALRRVLTYLKGQHPKAVIQGHRDFPKVAKDCPSFNVKKWLETIKL